MPREAPTPRFKTLISTVLNFEDLLKATDKNKVNI